MMKTHILMVLVAGGMLGFANLATAAPPREQDPAAARQPQTDQPTKQFGQSQEQSQQHSQQGQTQLSQKQMQGPAFRASELMGKEVKDSAGKDLGEVKDVVFAQDGSIRYLAITRGGVLGVGNKMYAIPWTSVQLKPSSTDPNRVETGFRGGATTVTSADELDVLLIIDEQSLESDPGFNEENWPANAKGQMKSQSGQIERSQTERSRTQRGQTERDQSDAINRPSQPRQQNQPNRTPRQPLQDDQPNAQDRDF